MLRCSQDNNHEHDIAGADSPFNCSCRLLAQPCAACGRARSDL